MQRYENMLAILRHERVKDIRAKGCYISLGSEANRGILTRPRVGDFEVATGQFHPDSQIRTRVRGGIPVTSSM
jgi:hypothetical protein